MELESIFKLGYGRLDYTAGGDGATSGQVVQVAGKAGVVTRDLDDSEAGYADVEGIFQIRAAAVVGNAGDNAWWDEDGDPYGDSDNAGKGALTTIASDGDFWVGTLVEDLAATDGEVKVALNVETPGLPAWTGKTHETKDDDYTVDAQDNGKVLHIATDAKTFTLPATSAGFEITFVNDGADAVVELTVSPNANDKITGVDLAGADNKDIVNTKATAEHGDFITLVGNGGDGWYIKAIRGTWALET
ncbi:hypothetical protein STSP2_03156 [Anaerohalosphaera lusitana]|uniref:Uncharacterized protein n=1 Tax=Anaerohalosphaera lusitana TaxID=1936003 RepID=A0A1U9NR12_9BACT|nr:DUF2190 family protein [Anaerohalosphaera lusitana]AQT69956.1 hypothetical protein STSP2_03156 [Anaerohalosphaera lusitana]